MSQLGHVNYYYFQNKAKTYYIIAHLRNFSIFIYFRVCSKPPYEVKETGWGEFEIQIRIYFHDPAEKPGSVL